MYDMIIIVAALAVVYGIFRLIGQVLMGVLHVIASIFRIR